MTSRIVVIADDLTGAADTGVSFAARGAETLVLWDTVSSHKADVTVITTESRHLAPQAAVDRVAAAVASLHGQEHALFEAGMDIPLPQARWVYKKIDSTLRGHPGLELAAVARGLGNVGVLVAPAFPAQGRTTHNGVQLIDGMPLTATVFGQEVASSDIGRLLARGFPLDRISPLPLEKVRAGASVVATVLTGDPTGIWVADAETDEDLDVLVRAAHESGIRLLCGSAGLGQALAKLLASLYGWQPVLAPHVSAGSGGRGVFVVAASRNPKTAAQVMALKAAGVPLVHPQLEDSDEGASPEIAGALCEGLAQGVAVLTTVGLPDLSMPGHHLAARLAGIVAAAVARQRPAGLILTGGDAAIAVSRALGARALHMHGEVAPGVPWGTLVGGGAAGIPVVTKAGGFGGEHTLLQAVQFLSTQREKARTL